MSNIFNLKRIQDIWKQPSKGFGDTVAKITKTAGIQPCAECEKRRNKWNEALAYKKSRTTNGSNGS